MDSVPVPVVILCGLALAAYALKVCIDWEYMARDDERRAEEHMRRGERHRWDREEHLWERDRHVRSKRQANDILDELKRKGDDHD